MKNKTLILVLLSLLMFSGCSEDLVSPDPPQVVRTSPGDGASNVPLDAVISATFTDVMDGFSFDSTTFFISGDIHGNLKGKIICSGATVRFAPMYGLRYSESYVAKITNHVRDINGTYLRDDYRWRFTMEPRADSTPPVVVSMVPADLSIGVPIYSAVSATFSKNIDPASVSSESFRISPSTPGNSWAQGNVLRFLPQISLSPATIYEIHITTDIRDKVGLPLAADFIWSFMTETKYTRPQGLQIPGDYRGRYAIVTGYGTDSVIERSQPVIWWFTDSIYVMKIDTSVEFDTNFSICRVDGKYRLDEYFELIQLHSLPDGDAGFWACRERDNPRGAFCLSAYMHMHINLLRMSQYDSLGNVNKFIDLHKE